MKQVNGYNKRERLTDIEDRLVVTSKERQGERDKVEIEN